MNERELLKLKEDIDSAKTEVAKLTGKHDHLIGELRGWDCKAVEDAEGQLKQMEVNIQNLDGQIKKGTKEIEDKYHV